MEKGIIGVFFSIVLLLIFTSLSYGGFDAEAKPLRDHLEQELLIPQDGDRSDGILLLIVSN
ncbi:MAG: hypothetical protein WBD64_00055 [Candidatus Zixiibacteriota bacterium]